MPKFKVYGGFDAWARRFAIIEAASSKEAEDILNSRTFKGPLFDDGVSEFDDFTVFRDETEALSDEEAEALTKEATK